MNSEKPTLLPSPSLEPASANEIASGMDALGLSETPHRQLVDAKEDPNSSQLHSLNNEDSHYSSTQYDHQLLYHQMYEQYVQSENVQQSLFDNSYRIGQEYVHFENSI